MIYSIVVGLIAGAVARLLVPGRDPIGILGTIVLGIVGSFLGGFLWNLIQYHKVNIHSFHTVGIIGSIIGAFVLLLITRLSGHEPGRRAGLDIVIGRRPTVTPDQPDSRLRARAGRRLGVRGRHAADLGPANQRGPVEHPEHPQHGKNQQHRQKRRHRENMVAAVWQNNHAPPRRVNVPRRGGITP